MAVFDDADRTVVHEPLVTELLERIAEANVNQRIRSLPILDADIADEVRLNRLDVWLVRKNLQHRKSMKRRVSQFSDERD